MTECFLSLDFCTGTKTVGERKVICLSQNAVLEIMGEAFELSL
jgi:hypothetical protein